MIDWCGGLYLGIDDKEQFNKIMDIVKKMEQVEKAKVITHLCRPCHFNDLDIMIAGKGLTEEQDKTHFGLWRMLSSPLIIGCDLREAHRLLLTISPKQVFREMLKFVICLKKLI